jgi:hypothetical protein
MVQALEVYALARECKGLAKPQNEVLDLLHRRRQLVLLDQALDVIVGKHGRLGTLHLTNEVTQQRALHRGRTAPAR